MEQKKGIGGKINKDRKTEKTDGTKIGANAYKEEKGEVDKKRKESNEKRERINGRRGKKEKIGVYNERNDY